MNFEYFIASRIHAGRSAEYSAPVIRIAYLSIALGLAMIIISFAIVIGFKNSISSKVTGFTAPLKVVAYDRNNSLEEQPVTVSDSLLRTLESFKGIEHVQMTAQKGGVLKTGDQIQGIVLKGVDDGYDWSFLQNNLIAGHIPGIEPEGKASDEVLISEKLAKLLNIDVGDPVRIWFISENAHTRGRKLTVSGIYQTSLEEFDNRYLIGDLRHIRKLNGWNNRQAGSIELLTNNTKNLRDLAYSLYHVLPYDMTVETVLDEYPEIFNWLDLLDTNVAVILVLMILVAGITMVSTLFILIIERTNMVGILKAIGATDGSIRKIFLYKASGIILKGSIGGNAVALLFYFLQKNYHLLHLDPASYYVDYVPVELHFPVWALINAGTFAVFLLILIIPSLSITRIVPSKALRYE